MASPRMIRALLISSTALMLISAAAGIWMEDSLYLSIAGSFALPAVTAAFLLRMRKLEIAANVPPPPEAPIGRNATWAGLFLGSAAVLALVYEWRLDSLWTPTVIFVLLFLLFMGVHYAILVSRQLRSPRSPSDGP